jgi:hypothetical protein
MATGGAAFATSTSTSDFCSGVIAFEMS